MVIVKYSEGKIGKVLDKTREEIEEGLKKKMSEEDDEKELNKEAKTKEASPPFWTK